MRSCGFHICKPGMHCGLVVSAHPFFFPLFSAIKPIWTTFWSERMSLVLRDLIILISFQNAISSRCCICHWSYHTSAYEFDPSFRLSSFIRMPTTYLWNCCALPLNSGAYFCSNFHSPHYILGIIVCLFGCCELQVITHDCSSPSFASFRLLFGSLLDVHPADFRNSLETVGMALWTVILS